MGSAVKPAPFAYTRARTLDEVFDLLDRHGAEAKILAGGQSLVPALNLRLAEPRILIDINRIAELAGIDRTGEGLRIGALVRHFELETSPLVARDAPLIAAAMPHVAHPAIRSRGTIGGSLALADPAAELPACCVALDAVLVLRSRGGERRVPAAEFFRGLYETALAPAELVAAVEIPAPQRGARSAFLELARRHGDYAMVGVAAQATVADGRFVGGRIVFFGIGAKPVLARHAMQAVADRMLDTAAIAAGQAALDGDLDPPGDLHGGPAMKRHLARVLLGRALAQVARP
jgi:carbon-monoxide dehydrogenase medium subunit